VKLGVEKIVFVTALIFITLSSIFFYACVSVRDRNNTRRVALTADNYWNFLNISIVHVNAELGTRLQIFPDIENASFENVIIHYLVYVDNSFNSYARVVQLNSNGVGQTALCLQVFPIIIGVRGSVVIRG